MYLPTLCTEGLDMKVRDIPKFENLIKSNVKVFELTNSVRSSALTPILINKNYLQSQIDLLLFEIHYCLITKLHRLINKDSHMKWVCKTGLTAFSPKQILFDHTSRCINQQPTNITFRWKDHLKFDDYHMKILLTVRVFEDFECNNQPTRNDQKVLFKQIPIAEGFYLISPFGNCYYSYFGESCVTWFVNRILLLEKIAGNIFKTNLELEITQEEESYQQSKVC